MTIEARRYAQRRQRLLDTLGEGLLIVPTAPQTLRNGDVHHSYRAGSDLHYLTGFEEPEAVLVAWRTSRGRHASVLFVQPRDKEREIWDGKRHGVRGAMKAFGVDRAHSAQDFWKELPALLELHDTLHCTLGRSAEFDAKLFGVFAELRQRRRRRNPAAHPNLSDPSPALARLRQIKDATELASMRRAAAVTARAHSIAMCTAAPGMTEFQVQAVIEESFRTQGSKRNGYESIVASGPNACILHYIENTRRIRKGDLLLVDAGAEIEHYTADITRTWPIGAPFSEAQRAVYDVVLRAQKACIRAVKPGKAWSKIHEVALREITKGLIKLGLLRGDLAKLVDQGACRSFYMHGTSHWLGMDVHDVGAYEDHSGKSVKLEPGMVLTVEPGLYFDPRDRSIPKEFRGIGVRIEDDVAVTKDGNDVLTDGVPKEIKEIEALMKHAADVPYADIVGMFDQR